MILFYHANYTLSFSSLWKHSAMDALLHYGKFNNELRVLVSA